MQTTIARYLFDITPGKNIKIYSKQKLQSAISDDELPISEDILPAQACKLKLSKTDFTLYRSTLELLVAELTRWLKCDVVKLAPLRAGNTAKGLMLELFSGILKEYSPKLYKELLSIEDSLALNQSVSNIIKVKQSFVLLLIELANMINEKAEEVRISNLKNRQYLNQNFQFEEDKLERRRNNGGAVLE